MGWLEGQVALVTGGAAGIGRAVVEAYVAEGARVGVLDRSAEALAALAGSLGDEVATVQGDVTDLVDNRRAVECTLEAFGQLDVFVGNAGISDEGASLDDIPEERISTAFDEIFGINVKGYLLGVKAALPALLEARGSVILTGSYSSFNTAGGGVLYIASKHAVAGVVRQLAYELAPKVRVNGVAPGVAPTQIGGITALDQRPGLALLPGAEQRIPLGFVPEASDHAAAYVLLASRDRARVITGTFITTDSGFGVRGIVQPAGGAHL